MAELAMLADIQRTVYSKEVTRQLHVLAQARESWPVIKEKITAVLLTVVCGKYFCYAKYKYKYNN